MLKYKTNACENVQTELSAYFDNEMPTWKRYLIQQHLKRCAKCNSRFVSIEQTDDILQFLEPIETSDTFLSGVMSRANTMKKTRKARWSLVERLGTFVEGLQVWIRGNIRAHSLVYMFGLIFALTIMIGVTLYSPNIDQLNPFTQYNSKSSQVQEEKLIPFEVILQQEPKRPFKIR